MPNTIMSILFSNPSFFFIYHLLSFQYSSSHLWFSFCQTWSFVTKTSNIFTYDCVYQVAHNSDDLNIYFDSHLGCNIFNFRFSIYFLRSHLTLTFTHWSMKLLYQFNYHHRINSEKNNLETNHFGLVKISLLHPHSTTHILYNSIRNC